MSTERHPVDKMMEDLFNTLASPSAAAPSQKATEEAHAAILQVAELASALDRALRRQKVPRKLRGYALRVLFNRILGG